MKLPKQYQISLVDLLIGIVIGIGIGYIQFHKNQPAAVAQQGASVPEDGNLQKPAQPAIIVGEMRALSGTITEVSKQDFVIEAMTPALRPDAGPETVQKKVQLESRTKIVRHVPKDHETFQREFAEFRRSKKPKLSQPPLPVSEEGITLAQLKVGDWVFVEAEEDFKAKEKFVATKVVLQEAPTAGAPVPPPPPAPKK
jgi:hypothetical protein